MYACIHVKAKLESYKVHNRERKEHLPGYEPRDTLGLYKMNCHILLHFVFKDVFVEVLLLLQTLCPYSELNSFIYIYIYTIKIYLLVNQCDEINTKEYAHLIP